MYYFILWERFILGYDGYKHEGDDEFMLFNAGYYKGVHDERWGFSLK